MKNLVICPCGHAISRHDYAGCVGEQFHPGCACQLTESAALNAAIDEAKTAARAEWTFAKPSENVHVS